MPYGVREEKEPLSRKIYKDSDYLVSHVMDSPKARVSIDVNMYYMTIAA